jgi:hypothetical protein
MTRLGREALLSEILSHLAGPRSQAVRSDFDAVASVQEQGREFAASDVHLTRLPGERPNWDVRIDGTEPAHVEEIKRALSQFDLEDESEAD